MPNQPDLSAFEIPEHLRPILVRLTWNGAYNLRCTLDHPHDRFPEILNGGKRLSTGLGKWTTLAAIGVENNLKALGLVEERALPWGGPVEGWKSLCLTPLGFETAGFLRHHWDTIGYALRDGRRGR